ncbi:MAG: hypothetical protein SNH27_04985 [Rikenellaceae bacterium]
MTNAQILAASLNQWATPIVEGAINHMAQESQLGYFMSAMISPQRIIKSLQEYIAIPILQENINKIPDPLIPSFALDVMDGMIETRVEKGPIDIPFINTSLGAEPFRNLKKILEQNLAEYGENIEVVTEKTAE